MKGTVATVETRVLEGLRILVVDDEEDSQTLLTYILEMHGAEVSAVVSADSAYQLLARTCPDLLLCDIAMPDENGYSLMRRVRALNNRTGEIPAIAISALASEVSLSESLEAGFQAYLAKPVDLDQLIETVLSVFQSKIRP
jgi:CheY-like chemotaxis protein